MGVQVAPGHRSDNSGRSRVKIVWKNITTTLPYEYSNVEYYSATGETGSKISSTSPRLVVEGRSWSPAHPYTRAASRLTNLGGYVKRSKPYTDKYGQPQVEYAEIRGGIPTKNNVSFYSSLMKSPYASDVGVPGPMPTNLRNRLLTELLLKAGNRQMSLGESLGEARMTVKQVASSVTKLYRSMLSLNVRNYKRAFMHLGITPKKVLSGTTPAEFWLEHHYGWMPLLSDIYMGFKTFQDGLKRPPLIRVSRLIKNYEEFDFSSRSGDGTVTHGEQLSGKSVRSAKAVAFYRLNSQWVDNIQRLGLVNPLEVAWALTPYSFVLDWVLPVQNTLEAMTSTIGLTFVDGSMTHRVQTECTMGYNNHPQLNSAAGPTYQPDWAPMYKVEQFGMVRTVLTGITPGLYVKNPFSSTHVISALALLRQLKR